jgi:tetratricopeptide (TPR) repeat protein
LPLITSRYWQEQDEAHIIELHGLDQQATAQLFKQQAEITGFTVEDVDPTHHQNLYQLTRGVPKAIQWSSALIHDASSVDWTLERLRTGTGELFPALFQQLWDNLEAAEQNVLKGLTTLVGGGSRACLAGLASLSDEEVHRSILRLRRASLIEGLEGRSADDELLPSFTLHPLTRAYVTQRLKEHPAHTSQLYLRRVTYFLDFSERFGGDIEHERWDHFDRLDSERENLLAVLTWCLDAEPERHRELLRKLVLYLFIYGRWNDLLDQCWKGVDNLVGMRTPQQLADTQLEIDNETAGQLAWLLRCIGRVLNNQDSYQEAQMVLDRALRLVKQAGDRSEHAYVCFHLGELAFRQRNLDLAEQWWRASLGLSRQIKPIHYRTGVTYWLGILAYARERYDEANDILSRNLQVCEQLNWTRLRAYHLGYLGEIARCQQRYDDARALLQQALELVESRDPRRRALVGLSFARLEQDTDNPEAARRWLEQTEHQLELLGMTRERREAANLADALDAAR